jgi:hypothetical protein
LCGFSTAIQTLNNDESAFALHFPLSQPHIRLHIIKKQINIISRNLRDTVT